MLPDTKTRNRIGNRKLSFCGIWDVAEKTMNKVDHLDSQALEVVVNADLEARRVAREFL